MSDDKNDIPQQHLDSPTTKGVSTVLFTLFDFNKKPPERIELEIGYDPNAPFEAYAPDGLKVSIHVGDNLAGSSISLPVALIHAGMSQVMAAHHERKNSGLVGFDKPQIIKPN